MAFEEESDLDMGWGGECCLKGLLGCVERGFLRNSSKLMFEVVITVQKHARANICWNTSVTQL